MRIVTQSALLQRLRRKLAREGLKLHITRGTNYHPALYWAYVSNLSNNAIEETWSYEGFISLLKGCLNNNEQMEED